MKPLEQAIERAGGVWLLLGLAAVLLLPWYRIVPPSLGDGASTFGSALTEGLAGRAWLLPVVAAMLALAALRVFAGERWRAHPAMPPLAIAGLVLLVLQAFGVGLRGPAAGAGWLASVAPAASLGQTGLGWGGFLTGLAFCGLIADALAARGFCRGDRFASAGVVIVVALLTLFVFFPIFRLASAAIIAPDGFIAFDAFAARLVAGDLWGTACLYSSARCGVVVNTLILGVLAGLISTALGLALALLVARTSLPFKNTLRAVSILPMITPPFVVGVAIVVLFGRTGLVTGWMWDLFGIPPSRWIYGLPGILLAQVLSFAPVTFLVLLGAVEAINPTLEEASKTLGARPLATFRTVTWPLLRPALAAAFLLAFIESLADFGNPIVLGGGYEVLSIKIFFAIAGARYDIGNAAVLAMVLLTLTLIAFWLQQRWVGSKSYVTVTGKSDAGLYAPLPRAMTVPVGLVAVLWVAITLGVYAIIIIGGFVSDIGRWDLSPTARHLVTAFSFEIGAEGLHLYGSAWNSLQTTLWVAAVAAPLTTAVGILTAYLVARQEFIGKRAFEFGTMLSFAIPGTVVGVSYVAAFNVPPIDITGTASILIICFIFRNMPVGMRAGIAALAQIDRSLEEASQTLGARGAASMRTVVLPLIRPAIFTAMVYSFVTAMTAVSAIIFLVSARHNMATAYIMGRVENGEYPLAIAYSAVLMIIMVVSVLLIRLLVGRRNLGRRAELQGVAAPAAAPV